MSDRCDCQFKALGHGALNLPHEAFAALGTVPGKSAQTHCSLVRGGSAGNGGAAVSNTVAFKRECAPRSRPASTRPKHNHAAAAVLIFEEWSLANYLYPFPDAATKAQMSADTGAVSLMCVCAPHAYRMQHSVACASEKTQARCQPQPPALPNPSALSVCARVRARESKSPFHFMLRDATEEGKIPPRTLLLLIDEDSRVPSGLRVDQVCTWFANMRKRMWRPGRGLPAGTRLPVKDASFLNQVRPIFSEVSLAQDDDAGKILRTGLRTSSTRCVAVLSQSIQVSPSQSPGPVDFSDVRPSPATLWRSSSPAYPWHVSLDPSSLGMQMPSLTVETPPLLMLVPARRSPSTSSFTWMGDAPLDEPWVGCACYDF